jgi:hypothetical protein
MRTVIAFALAALFAGAALADGPDKKRTDEAELLKALRDASAVFTAELGGVKPVAQTNSIPPTTRGEVSFKEAKPLRGKAGEKVYGYTYREGATKNVDLGATGRVLVAVKDKDVLAIVPATEANLALVKKAEEKK